MNSESTRRFQAARQVLLDHYSDYESAYRLFRWPDLKSFNWALDWFDVYAKNNPQIALRIVRGTDGDRQEESLSFDRLSRRSSHLASELKRIGFKRRDRILVLLPNVICLWEILLAAMKLGGVVVPTSTQATEEDLADRIKRGEIDFILTDIPGADRIDRTQFDHKKITAIVSGEKRKGWISYEDLIGESKKFVPEGTTLAEDPLLLYFTSGTTAKPKLVLHTHQSYPVGHLSTMYWIGIREGDIHQNISSPGWAKHAWSSFFAPWNAGATVLQHDYLRFNARQSLALISGERVSTLCAPPTVWRMLVQETLGPRPEKLRELVSAGEPLNPEVIAKVEANWKIQIRDGFGQTETTAQIGNTPGQPLKPGSMGRVLPGFEAVLLTSQGVESNEGEISLRLTPRPIGLMAGYHDDAERTHSAMNNGYYRTGDEATCDGEGYFHYVGRGDDVFKSSDYRISPSELESVLIECPAIAEAAVIPSPDSLRFMVPKAFVVLKTGEVPSRKLAKEIFQFVKKKLAAYKRIRKIEFSALPKTISGKIRRVELRSLEAQRVKEGLRGQNEYWMEDFWPPSR